MQMATQYDLLSCSAVLCAANSTTRSGSSQAALRGSVAVHGGSLCIQSLVLPNFERLVLRSPAQDTLFTPWFFGQAGDQSKLCGHGDCDTTLDLASTRVMDGEHTLMPNGNERSMQFAALYSVPPSPAPPLGLYLLRGIYRLSNPLHVAAVFGPIHDMYKPWGRYVGAHSPNADLMMLLMEGSYCKPPSQSASCL